MLSKTGEFRQCLYFKLCKKSEIKEGKRWKEHWHKYKDGYLCKKHYGSIVRSPSITSEERRKWHLAIPKEKVRKWRKTYTSKRITFLGKRVSLSFEPRTGFCSICPNNIYDGTCNATNLHHYFYLSIMMWACTVEKCASCHTTHHNLLLD